MRLLRYNNDGDLSLTEFFESDIPKYAILSHRWGAEEVTFKDLIDGTSKSRSKSKSKAGYGKIQFCGEQAEHNGLQYFWVDTCCIDKSNSTELAEAINSMFRWYRDATKCYVYLPDVSRPRSDSADESNEVWKSTFRKSEWFTRGWTLQELIAPASVDFFSIEGELLGNKASLERYICEITGIPANVLRGSPLSGFSITERMSWAASRETYRQEDKAYSLLGIFDVNMPLIYGEGKDRALQRLREEINKASKGVQREDFSITFSLSDVPGIEHFVAREEELAEIHRILKTSDSSRQTVVLHGLGGIGKTSLSVAYAKRHKDSYSAIFWLNIKDEDSLKQSFAKVARQILREHPSFSQLNSIDMKGDLDKVVDAVKAWLSLPNNTRWLIIYDNYDNPKLESNLDPVAVDIRKYLPESYQGSVIITTRSALVKTGHRIQVGKLKDVRDSLRILLHESRREDAINDSDALALAEKLDGLPLALATAGAYLDQVSTSFSDYLRLFGESWLRLLEESPHLDSYEDRALYTTWNLSWNHVKKQNMLSAKLLQLWAYFDNQDVWFNLLQHKESSSLGWFSQLIEDEVSFTRAMRVLCDHGLVEAEKSSEEQIEAAGYSMHGCVHLWTIYVLNKDWDCEMAELALKCIGSHVPGETARKGWLIQRRMLRHALRFSDILSKGLLNNKDLAWAFHNLGMLYVDLGKLEEAGKMYQRALLGYEKAWGPEHTSTLDTVNNLGLLYAGLGKVEEAEKMYQRALLGKEKAWGQEHTSTLDTVNNLGALYADLGKLEEAEKMYQRALLGKEKAWGPEHTSTLDTINNLGALYVDLGKLEEAEKMYQRALLGKEKAWGPEHTSTLDTINNLGALYADLGKLEEAEKMYQRALLGKEKAWGPEHTSTLDTINNLGALYVDLGKLEEAEKMYQRALLGKEKAWGPEHTSTLDTINNLGALYADLGKLEEAEKMYQRALLGKEKAWGPEHTSTLDTINNLGALYVDLGKLEEAEKMYQRALLGKEKAWGPEHTSTLDTINNLGALYADLGKLQEAEKMYQRALLGFDKAWGPEHISTLATVNNLGTLYKKLGKLQEAEKMYQRALLGKEKAWGPEHISTLATVNNLGTLYAGQGKLEEAEKMYQRALLGYEKALGTNFETSIPALNTIWGLANLFELRTNLAKARIMYSKAVEGYEKVVGLDHPRSQQLRNKLHRIDAATENKALLEERESMNIIQEQPLGLGTRERPSKSKWRRLLSKMGLR